MSFIRGSELIDQTYNVFTSDLAEDSDVEDQNEGSDDNLDLPCTKRFLETLVKRVAARDRSISQLKNLFRL